MRIAVLLLAAALSLLPHPAARIVSLIPSYTEDLCALGAGKQLVAVSEFSGDISCARGLPQVNDFASLNAEKVISLRPDAVVGIPSQQMMTAALRRAGVRVELFANDSLDDLFSDIARLGEISGRRAQASALLARLRAQTAALRSHEHLRARPSVFFVAQAQPLWTVGPRSYIATLVDLAGGRLATQSLTLPYAQYSYEALMRSDPDVLVATNDSQLGSVLNREPWRSLRAVRERHVYILQNSALLVRPGPRYNEGLRWLIERFSSL
jgi:iron complex transport system substrate-binding protein